LAVLAGLASGLVAVSAASGSNGAALAFLAPLSLVSVGLTCGWPRLLIAVAAATAFVGLVGQGAAGVLIAHLLLGSLPAVVVVGLALTRRKTTANTTSWLAPGSVLAGLVVVALVVTVGTCLTLPTGSHGIEAWVADDVAHAIDEAAPEASADYKAMVAKISSALFPAMAGAGWLILAILNGLVGQWVAVKSGRALRATPDFLALTLPRWLLVPLVIAAGLGIFAGGDAGYLARNAAAILLAPYTVLGVTVVHRGLRQKRHGSILLPLFYVVFFLLIGWAMVVLAAVGLVKQWTGLRRKDNAVGQEDQ
jgi:hypothetical protein